jgi:replication factor A1
MSNDDIQRHIDEIIDALSESSDKEVNREELEKEFRKFLEYGVPPDHTKQTLIKKFGGGFIPPSPERTLIVDLKPNSSSVHILCRVVAINPKDITVKGEPRKIFYGIFGDESGTMPFTAWKDFQITKGDVVDIANAYTKEWQGATKINLGDKTKITKTDESKIPMVNFQPKECKLKDIRSGLGAVVVTARILEINQRDVEVDGKPKKVYSGLLGDETGKTQFTSWYDHKLKEGFVVKVTGAYVKIWKGIPQVTFDEKSTVEKLDANKIPKQNIAAQRLPLHELVERNGALDVEVEGTVIEIKKGSGLINRCPQCNRVVQDNNCSIHGQVSSVPDLRIKLTIDDGTGTIGGLIGKELTEKLLGKSFTELKKLHEKSDSDHLVEELQTMLFAHKIILKGNALGDEFGVTVIAQDAILVDIDVPAESEKLLHDLEELL